MTRNGNCPRLRWMWNCLWLPLVRARRHPSASRRLITSRTFIADAFGLLPRREKEIVSRVSALGFRVFVRLVARVVTGLAAVRVDALNRGNLGKLSFAGVAHHIHQQPRDGPRIERVDVRRG